MISVEFGRPEPFAAGQDVEGVVIWDPAGVTRARGFECTIGWSTPAYGHSDRDSATVATFSESFGDGSPTSVMRFPFRFEIPDQGPTTYRGKLFSITWTVQARIDVGWGKDPKVEREFTVVPRRA